MSTGWCILGETVMEALNDSMISGLYIVTKAGEMNYSICYYQVGQVVVACDGNETIIAPATPKALAFSLSIVAHWCL